MEPHPDNRRRGSKGDPVFKWIALGAACTVPVLMSGILVELIRNSHLSLAKFGLGFLTSSEWDPVTEHFGAFSSVYGTAVSTIIAMIIAVPLGLVIALFLVELAPPRISAFFGTAIELLAAIPSIIYGMWGLFVFAPFMAREVQPLLGKSLGFLPLFTGPPLGIGMLTTGIILALMILPYISSVTRDVFSMVPQVVKEAAYGMGATNWEVTRGVTLPYSLKGIVGAGFLGLGRALGETMAVTFVIGNNHNISTSLFASGNSIASTLANEFTEATSSMYLSSLIELGLVLFLMTVAFQAAAQAWLWGIRRRLAV
jgi:phosphate transport system permease protein